MANRLLELCEKTLNLTSRLFDTYTHRSARPYYPLNNGWGLTYLSTGQPFFVNTEDRNITPWIIMGGHWEPNVDRVMMAYAKPGMAVLDIGAHFGYYTVKLGTAVGHAGFLMAFEPNPEVNAVCLENIKINGLSSHVFLNTFALGDETTTATLTRSHSNMASANLVGEQVADYSVQVDVKRLDDTAPKDLRFDLIKLDAEGYEAKILQGGQVTLASSPDCSIMIELGLDRWERNASLLDLIPLCGGNGRRPYAVHHDGTIELFDIGRMRDFLLGCSFHENYFLVGRPDVVETQVGELIRR
jgi:FkbM family methyltransferase